MDKKTPLQKPGSEFGFTLETIETAFQSRHPKFYTNAEHLEERDNLLAMIMKSLEKVRADFPDTFKKATPQEKEVWLSVGIDRSFIAHLTYDATSAAGTTLASAPRKESMVMIGRLELDGNGMYHDVTPFYLLQGYITTPPDSNGQEIFFPHESGCLIKVDKIKEDCFSFAENSDEFIQMLCYGRKAFERVLTDQPLSIPPLQYWIEKENENQIGLEYQSMMSMSPSDFEEMIASEKEIKARKESSFYITTPSPYLN